MVGVMGEVKHLVPVGFLQMLPYQYILLKISYLLELHNLFSFSFFNIILFIYFCQCWIFNAVCRLSLVGAIRATLYLCASGSHSVASLVVENRLRSCGARTLVTLTQVGSCRTRD